MPEYSLDWDEVISAAESRHLTTAKEIRQALPVGFVLQKYGVDFEQVGDKLSALCPFHDDTEESFDVFGENLEFWGCHPCYGGIGGDVVDLIRAFEGLDENDTPAAIERANELIAELDTDGYAGPTEGRKHEPLNVLKAERFVARSYIETNLELLDAFCQFKGLKVTGDYLHREFGVGTWADLIVIPFYGPNGELVTYRRRYFSTHKPGLARGSNMDDTFYNHWRLTSDISRTIVLCEGETDTWATHATVGDRFTVLGIPTGAGDEKELKEPAQARLLDNRRVILAFDGDTAGKAARQAWYDALTKKYNCEVLFAPVPEGRDMCTVDDIASIVDAATITLIQAPTTEIMVVEPEGYVRPARSVNGSNTPLSNWYFKPVRELIGDDGVAYEGYVEPGHSEGILSSFDLKSKSKTVDWSTRQRRYWAGSDRDSQLVLGLLQAQGPFLMTGRMATVAGLHEKHFVFPGGKIGPDYWKYVRPTADVHLDSKIFVQEGEWNPSYLFTMRKLHQQAVMDPILAWLAVAPLRSLLREFPPLSLTGSSGTGKTTLIETVTQAFSGSSIANNLTSTTKHALFAYLGCTNAFPVWFDEYRPGARKDALITLEQIIRDAFTSQASSKGGLGEHWAEVQSVATHAPLIISGEDSFNETSHTERMVLVMLPMEGKNEAALHDIRAWGESGFAHAYLSWLQRGLATDSLPVIENKPMGDSNLPPRQRLNMGVLHLGWELLTAFMNEHGEHLSAADFSLVTREAREAMKHAPIEDALRWCSEEGEAATFLFYWIDDETQQKFLCCRVENFVSYIETRAKGIYTLPGGVTAVRRHLETKYGAQERVITHFGTQKRVLAIPTGRLNWTER